MQILTSFLKKFGILLALVFLLLLVGGIHQRLAGMFGLGVAVAAIVSYFRPLPKLMLNSKIFATILVILFLPIGLALALMPTEDEQLTKLQTTDPDAYAAEMKKRADASARAAEIAAIQERKRAEDKAAANAAKVAEAAAAAKAQDDKRIADAKSKLEKYKEQLRREIASISDFKVSTYTEDVDSINMSVILFGAWDLIYDEGNGMTLDEEAKKLRSTFKSSVSKVQINALPKLRDAYGPAMSRQLWEADGSARTFGAGYRTIELVSVTFARNANIKQIHEQMHENFRMLRFTRAQYKWFKQASEYSYYSIEGPQDGELVKWHKNGSYVALR